MLKLKQNLNKFESIVLDKKDRNQEEKSKEVSLENVIKVIKSFKSSEDIPDKIDELTDKANDIKR